MGCAASTQSPDRAAAPPPSNAKDSGREKKSSLLGNLTNRKQSALAFSNLSGRRRSSSSFFGRFSATAATRQVAAEDDPLALGTATQKVTAPSQWLVVMGAKSSGKSTLIRQIKMTHEGEDAADSQRFVREVRKVALDLIKQAAKEVAPMLTGGDAKDAAERIQALGRRVQVNAKVASDVHLLWQSPEMAKYEAKLADPQRRKACRHYVHRIDELAHAEYVPEPLDLLHMGIPTVGQQDTRVPSFPGGELTLVEVSSDVARRSSLVDNEAVKAAVRLVSNIEGKCGLGLGARIGADLCAPPPVC